MLKLRCLALKKNLEAQSIVDTYIYIVLRNMFQNLEILLRTSLYKLWN